MLTKKTAAFMTISLLAACEMPLTQTKADVAITQPTSTSEAARWLKADGFDVVNIDRSESGQLVMLSRSNTEERLTTFDATTYAILSDEIMPIFEERADRNTARASASNRPRQGGSTGIPSGSSSSTTSESTSPTGGASSTGSAASESNSPTSSDSRTEVRREREETKTEGSDGFTRTTSSTTTTSSSESTVTIGN